ncbi:hypothetical protein [Oceanospirillum sediminis]|nr:hypothetical protein [Oceanospirillum sediminis]
MKDGELKRQLYSEHVASHSMTGHHWMPELFNLISPDISGA